MVKIIRNFDVEFFFKQILRNKILDLNMTNPKQNEKKLLKFKHDFNYYAY